MNKIFKLVWSKTRNMYVAVCEFARSRTKTPSVSGLNHVVVSSVLAIIFSCGAVMPVPAEAVLVTGGFKTPKGLQGGDEVSVSSNDLYYGIVDGVDYGRLLGGSANQLVTFDFNDASLQAAIAAVGSGGGTTYTAGNGITISGETISAKAGNGITVGSSGIAVKAGTNVTVNGNGISVTGNGTVASGNTGLIDGGKLYTEVRPSDNGNYVKYKNQPP